MYDRKIPSLEYIINLSNYDILNIKNKFDKYNSYNIPQLIIDYYTNYSDMKPVQYTIKSDKKGSKTIPTLLGIGNEKINYDNIKIRDSKFIQYNEDIIDTLNFNNIETSKQNHSLTDVVYDNGVIHVGKTDYKSRLVTSYLLMQELIKIKEINLEQHNKKDFPIRNELLQNISDFKYPSRPMGSTSGGVIIANTNDTWKIILGKRSADTNINRNKISMFPNGKIQYDDAVRNLFDTTLKREFTEELFDESSNGDIFFEDYITYKPVSAGWNLRDGDLSIGYVLIINSQIGYDMFKNILNKNNELNEIIEVPLNDITEIYNILDIKNTSGTPIATICEALNYIDNNSLYPDLPYNINSSNNFELINTDKY